MLEEFEHFCEEEQYWLEDYCLFMAGKDAHEGRCWLDWNDDLSNPTPLARRIWMKKLEDEIRYYQFVQFIFQKQSDRAAGLRSRA